MPTKLLIYDGECTYCRGFARLVRFLDRRRQVALAPYGAIDSQELLRAQFGDSYGFTMYLFEESEVSWGREAARRIVEGISLPRWLAEVALYLYPELVWLVSRLTRRTCSVCGPECTGLVNQRQTQQSVRVQEGAIRELQRILK